LGVVVLCVYSFWVGGGMEIKTNSPVLAQQLSEAAKRVGNRYVSIGVGEMFIDKRTGDKLVSTQDADFVRWDYSSRWVEGMDESGELHKVRSLDVQKLSEVGNEESR
jgi:hypothetical protein